MEPKKEMETMVKVGPYGWEGYVPWDEKGKSMLTQIFISYDSTMVYSIQTAYIQDGKLQLSDKHGGNGEMFQTVEIDYPSDFLTGISGYKYCDYRAGVLKSLTFETNRRKFGPFGPEEGDHFCIQMGTKRFFGGFHGSTSTETHVEKYLKSIGVYLKPINPLEDTALPTSTVPMRPFSGSFPPRIEKRKDNFRNCRK